MLGLLVAAAVTGSTWTCEAEDARIVQHLEDALVQLRTSPPPGLTHHQLERRARVLGLLEDYIAARRFPRRHEAAASPVFVDDTGAACAMGALIAATGGASITEHIRQTRNLATVPNLVDEPGVVEWLSENGLAPEEAALVQPAYFQCSASFGACNLYRAQLAPLQVAVTPTDGGPNPPPYLTVSARPDVGLCPGDPARVSIGYGFFDQFDWLRDWTGFLPLGAIVDSSTGLVSTARGPVPVHWVNCPEAPVVTERMRRARSYEACVHEAIKSDVRWALPVCYYSGRPIEALVCAPDGRVRSSVLVPKGTLADVVNTSFDYEEARDAGFGTLAAEALEAWAWDHSDDGGAPVTPVVPARYLRWDGGVDSACVLARDAGTWRDAGPPPDAGAPARDAGPDAGAGTDADAGGGEDAGAPDGGRPPDAGAPVDAGEWLVTPRPKDTFVPPATYRSPENEAGCSAAGAASPLWVAGLAFMHVWRRRRHTR